MSAVISSDSEAAWIEALKQHDRDALAAIFERYSPRIYRLAVSLLHDAQQADGVVQNTFLALIENIETFEGRSGIGTWLYRVAYNECAGRLRSHHHHPQVDFDELEDAFMPSHFNDWSALPDHILSGEEAWKQMTLAISSLPPGLRDVFTLRDVEELSTTETAQVLNISEAAVKVRLHRARLMLREKLAVYFEEYAR